MAKSKKKAAKANTEPTYDESAEHVQVPPVDDDATQVPTKRGRKPKAKPVEATTEAEAAEEAVAPAPPATDKTPATETVPVPAKKPRKSKKAPIGKRVNALDAAAQVLAKNGGPMNCPQMIEAMTAQDLWSSPAGKTPHATLYSAIVREINTKGNASRFQKTDRGQFVAKGA